jgi:hypothetical protein
MAKLMKKHGDDTPIHFDEFLFNLDPSAYEIIDDSPAKPAKKAKADAPSGDFDFDV